MSTRSKNRDLLQRNGIWHFNKRLPDGSGHLRRSLKTKDVEEARQKRDQLLEDWPKIAEKVQMSELDTATFNHVYHLRKEIDYLWSLIDPNIGGQGTIYTTIRTLEKRVEELEGDGD